MAYSLLYARPQLALESAEGGASLTALSLSPRAPAAPSGRTRRSEARQPGDGSQTHRPSETHVATATERSPNVRNSYTFGAGPQPGHVQKSPEHLLFESLRQTPEAEIRKRDVLGRHGARGAEAGASPGLLRLSLEAALPRLRSNDAVLVSLSLNQDINVSSAQALSDALGACTVLRSLDIFGGLYPMSSPACCALCDGVGASVSLQKLDLLGNTLLDAGATALGKALRQTQSLRSFNVSYCGIGPPGGECLAEGLRQCQSLKDVNVAGNAIKDQGCAAFGRALPTCKGLTSMNLSDCRIAVQGCTALCEGE